jgi:replication factor A2
VQELALQVTLVGMVHDKEERATDVSFQLDDTTGQIEVKRWIDGQEQHEMQEMNNIRNFTYVRVHGHLRSFQGKRNIVAFSVR